MSQSSQNHKSSKQNPNKSINFDLFWSQLPTKSQYLQFEQFEQFGQLTCEN